MAPTPSASVGCPFVRVLYLHFVLLLALFTSCESASTTTPKGGCPLSRLQAAFQAPFNSLSLALHGQQQQQRTAAMSSVASREKSTFSGASSSSSSGGGSGPAPRWVTAGARSRVVRSRTVNVRPLGMSAVETKPGSKRAAEGQPEEAKETKAEKKARRMAASSTPLGVHVIGLSHHNAGVDVREKLAVPEAEWNLASAKVRAGVWACSPLLLLGRACVCELDACCAGVGLCVSDLPEFVSPLFFRPSQALLYT